jgi:hypothetical protein
MSEDWFSSTLPKDKIQELWRSSGASRKAFGEKGQGRSLLTVGAKGIGPNTVRVRVNMVPMVVIRGRLSRAE